MNNGSRFEVKIFSTIEECKAFYDQWNELLENSNANYIFSTFEWVESWYEVFSQNSVLMVFFIFDREVLIGIAPFVISQCSIFNLCVKKIEFIGSDCADYNNIIMRNGYECDVLKIVFHYLFENEKLYDIISLSDFTLAPQWIDFVYSLTRHYKRKCNVKIRKNPVIILHGSYDSYIKDRPKKIIKETRKLLKKGTVRLQVVSDTDELKDFFQVFKSFYEKRAVNRKRWYSFLENPSLQFYKFFSEKVLHKGWLHFTILYLDQQPLAAHLGFIFNSRLYYYAPVFDEASVKLSPGVVHLNFLVREAYSKNYAIFDLLRGNEWFKYLWANESVTSNSFFVSGSSIYKKALFHIFCMKIEIQDMRIFGPIRHIGELLHFYWWRYHAKKNH